MANEAVVQFHVLPPNKGSGSSSSSSRKGYLALSVSFIPVIKALSGISSTLHHDPDLWKNRNVKDGDPSRLRNRDDAFMDPKRRTLVLNSFITTDALHN